MDKANRNKIIVIIAVFVVALLIFAQIFNSVKLSTESAKITEIEITQSFEGVGSNEAMFVYKNFPYLFSNSQTSYFVRFSEENAKYGFYKSLDSEFFNRVQNLIAKYSLKELKGKTFEPEEKLTNMIVANVKIKENDEEYFFRFYPNILSESEKSNDEKIIEAFFNELNLDLNTLPKETFYTNQIKLIAFAVEKEDKVEYETLNQLDDLSEGEEKVVSDPNFTLQKILEKRFLFKNNNEEVFNVFYSPVIE